MNYTKLMRAVEKAGFAMENLPSLPHINVVGSVITATHGSGHKYPIMAKKVLSLDIVHPDGTMRTYDNSMADFEHYLISFGSLGVVVGMTMSLLPHFMVAKGIYTNL